MIEHRLREPASPRALRVFGLVVGTLLTGVGTWPAMTREEDVRWLAVGIAAAFIGAAAARPVALRPIHRAWMKWAELVGDVLGWTTLALLFYFVITPAGLLRQALGTDPMRRRFDRAAESYRIPKPPRPPSHVRRQF